MALPKVSSRPQVNDQHDVIRLRPDDRLATTLKAFAGSWYKAIHIDPDVNDGHIRNSRHVSSAIYGALEASFALLWSRVLPPWFDVLWMLLYSLPRIETFASRLRAGGLIDGLTSTILIRAVWGCWTVCSYQMLPLAWRFSTDLFILNVVAATSMAGLDYMLADAPKGEEWLGWRLQLNYSFGFGLATWMLLAPDHLITLFGGTMHTITKWTFRVLLMLEFPWGSIILTSLRLDDLDFYWDLVVSGRFVSGRSLAILAITPLVLATWVLTPEGSKWKQVARHVRRQILDRLGTVILPKLFAVEEVFSIVLIFLPDLLLRILLWSAIFVRNRRRSLQDIPVYQYQSLPPNHIRVLLLQRSFLDIPRTRLIATEAGKTDYEAISYRWGESALTEVILVGDERLLVSRTTFSALKARQSIWRERLIWIDAICINQGDETEKSHQVAMMHEIYKLSSRVLILTDGSNWQSCLVTGLLYRLGRHPTLALLEDRRDEYDAMYYYGWPTYGIRWRILARLLYREYWIRVWIVQEIVSGQRVELYLGGTYVPWDVFYDAVRLVQTHDKIRLLARWKPSVSAKMGLIPITIVNHLKHGIKELSGFKPQTELIEFQSLLHLTPMFQASDERDKAYAFYALAGDSRASTNGLLKVDYSISAEDVSERVARLFFLQREKPSLSLLCYAGIGFPTRNRPTLSWVPNLSYTTIQHFTDYTRKTPRFRASEDRAPQTKQTQLLGINAISVRGTISDVVDILSPIREMNLTEQSEYEGQRQQNIAEWLLSALELVNSRPNVTGGRLEHVLIADADLSITSADLDLWVEEMCRKAGLGGAAKPVDSTSSTSMDQLNRWVVGTCAGRRFGITRQGRFCLVPPLTIPGDKIVILFGTQTPFVLRTAKRDGVELNLVIGEAFVQGLMYGEGVRGSTQVEYFDLL